MLRETVLVGRSVLQDLKEVGAENSPEFITIRKIITDSELNSESVKEEKLL
jgi:hypothetical protein